MLDEMLQNLPYLFRDYKKEQRHLMGPWDPGPGTQIVPDPGPVKCLEGTRTLGTQMTGPECWDPNFWDPSVGTLRPGTRMKGPK